MIFLTKILLAVLVTSISANDKSGLRRATLPFEYIELFFEYNDSDQDLGVQLNMVPSEPYSELEIFYPNGDEMLAIDVEEGTGIDKQGLSDLFFETGEPNFKDVSRKEILRRFPAGKYKFLGKTKEGQTLLGYATLTKKIPDGPTITSPGNNAKVDNDSDLVVTWEPVTTPSGIDIESYEVIVTKTDDPSFALDVRFPSDATSATIPMDFLEAGIKYELEVLAREVSGNQAISSMFFNVKK